MGNVRAYSVRNGNQSSYSHADKIIVSINKDQQIFNNRKILMRFIRKDTNIDLEFMILCLKCTYELTAFHLEKIWTGTRSFLSSFLFSTSWFIVWVRIRYQLVPYSLVSLIITVMLNEWNLAKTAQHSCNEFLIDVSRLVWTEHARNKYSLLNSLCLNYSCDLNEFIKNVSSK